MNVLVILHIFLPLFLESKVVLKESEVFGWLKMGHSIN